MHRPHFTLFIPKPVFVYVWHEVENNFQTWPDFPSIAVVRLLHTAAVACYGQIPFQIAVYIVEIPRRRVKSPNLSVRVWPPCQPREMSTVHSHTFIVKPPVRLLIRLYFALESRGFVPFPNIRDPSHFLVVVLLLSLPLPLSVLCCHFLVKLRGIGIVYFIWVIPTLFFARVCPAVCLRAIPILSSSAVLCWGANLCVCPASLSQP